MKGFCDSSSDPLLNLLLKKGVLSEEEAQAVKAEAEAGRTNLSEMPPIESKWKISKALKSVELFGDVRLRFEDREAKTPPGGRLEIQRARYSVRLGLRGDAFDNFYYGVRAEMAANPRSPWVTFGTSTSGNYQGPFGKSTAGVNIGQAFIGWRPANWLDITVGKMPNPLYTTPLVWDTDLNPEGAAERFKRTVGQADFFATFGQFLYADFNPNYASPNLVSGLSLGQNTDNIFLIAWQAGLTYHFTTNISAKAAATLYHYMGVHTNDSSLGFNKLYVGEGAFLGPGAGGPPEGSAGFTGSAFANNQSGLNHLLILEIPAQLDFKLGSLDARLFGDVAYNLEGEDRAEDAATAYAEYISLNNGTLKPFSAQKQDRMAYQAGFAIGSAANLGMVSGTTSRKNAWEFRSYWQHVEQYALDPNLLDSDFMEGRGNLEGIYAAAAYGFTDNVIGTVRYGYARRINDRLGTGGNNQDIPQINPMQRYNLLLLDLTLRF